MKKVETEFWYGKMVDLGWTVPWVLTNIYNCVTHIIIQKWNVSITPVSCYMPFKVNPKDAPIYLYCNKSVLPVLKLLINRISQQVHISASVSDSYTLGCFCDSSMFWCVSILLLSCMNMAQFANPFSCWQTFELFSFLGYYE